MVALCCLIVWALMRSPWGRVLKGIREDEDAVRSLGKNVYAYKMQSLIIGGLIGGLGRLHVGAAALGDQPVVLRHRHHVLRLHRAARRRRRAGPRPGRRHGHLLVPASASSTCSSSQATAGTNPLIPASIMNNNQASLMRFIFMGLALMLLMVFRPQGIFGDRRELALDAR